jgi:hypothetical protein
MIQSERALSDEEGMGIELARLIVSSAYGTGTYSCVL